MKKQLSLEEDIRRAERNVERQKVIIEMEECNLLRLEMNKVFISRHPKVHFALYTQNPRVDDALFALENNKGTDPIGYKLGEHYGHRED